MGVSQQDVTLEKQELTLTLNSAPSVACWISIFTGRFDISTQGKFAAELKRLRNFACQLACNFVMQVPSSPDQLPRSTAVGSFLLALLMTRLMQIDDIQLCLLCTDRVSWMVTRLQSTLDKWNVYASPTFLDPHMFTSILERVTQNKLEEIIADAATVASICLPVVSVDSVPCLSANLKCSSSMWRQRVTVVLAPIRSQTWVPFLQLYTHMCLLL